MSAFNFASSAKTTVNAGSGAELVDEFGVLTAAGIDEARKMDAATPIQGEKYFKTKNVDKNNYSFQAMNNIGLTQLNSDGDFLPIDKKSLGFAQTISNYTMRNSMMITRELLETDRYGVIGDHSRSLVHSARKTIERILADPFNRGFGTTDLAVLAEDGLGFFSAARPQPKSSAGTWSNLETSGALTADAVATARVNFRKYLDGSGDLDPQVMKKIIVSPDQEDTIREITGTTLKVDTSLNNTNIVSDVSYEVWDWLSSGIVAYCGDAENDLQFHVRVSPEVTVYQEGDPDKLYSRLRMALGTGLLRPAMYRGQVIV